ncbi:50S ribosomal protein L19e [Thecamonas trahens ATCC 50062]|uniref:50S ribosomal protein L19e n=1 Tax=Thecamonas trahens ATCC 50062 TaxID=461836 RepID=A0A0L0DJD2_THETB|nr:50S ribosomal protein L19e [Thecamonas trahens ATCC 50062]KNC51433.1 50S ribosomal protein L19e [Thecamonas trahens ATCC 50062]|eukprot:XP_013756097.1 50S ribosomal protein L19e [Thecamonas trahens ATCC 50062]
MVKLTTVKRLGADILKCGTNKVWLDPNEVVELASAGSRNAVRRYIKLGYVVKKPSNAVSRARIREHNRKKRLGRYTGFGHRKGTANARMPRKTLWIRRQRVLRRLLRKYRAAGKIDNHLYHKLYLQSKGNVYKNKRVLIEHIHYEKAEAARSKALAQAAEAHKNKVRAAKARRAERKAAKAQAAREAYDRQVKGIKA